MKIAIDLGNKDVKAMVIFKEAFINNTEVTLEVWGTKIGVHFVGDAREEVEFLGGITAHYELST